MNLGEIKLEEKLVKAIKEMGYKDFTAIQLTAIPQIQKGHDVIGQSSTGSGKTAAFGLPILEKVHSGKGVQALILTPTRELCHQVADSMTDFAKYAGVKIIPVYGGVGIYPQIDALKRADIVVGTPGRILDHMRQNTIKLDKVKFFVLDEMDRMCDMGFFDDVEKITRALPENRQMLLFSATYNRDVGKLVDKYMKAPVEVAGVANVDPSLLHQIYYDIASDEKFSLLMHLVNANTHGLSLIFCSTRREVDVLTKNLEKNSVSAMAIHGGLRQAKRTRALGMLKDKHIDILVATDVAARGLDIGEVKYVYNWDVPSTPKEYVHRVGRTARAGKDGLAITLLAPQDHMNFREVLRDSSVKVAKEPTPNFTKIIMDRRLRSNDDFGGRERGHRRPMHSGARMGGGRGFGPRREHSHSTRTPHATHSRSEGAVQTRSTHGGWSKPAGFAPRKSHEGEHSNAHTGTGFRSGGYRGRSGGEGYGRREHSGSRGFGGEHKRSGFSRGGSGGSFGKKHNDDFSGLSSGDFKDISDANAGRRKKRW